MKQLFFRTSHLSPHPLTFNTPTPNRRESGPFTVCRVPVCTAECMFVLRSVRLYYSVPVCTTKHKFILQRKSLCYRLQKRTIIVFFSFQASLSDCNACQIETQIDPQIDLPARLIFIAAKLHVSARLPDESCRQIGQTGFSARLPDWSVRQISSISATRGALAFDLSKQSDWTRCQIISIS